MLIIECSQGCYGRTDGSVTISLRNFVHKEQLKELVSIELVEACLGLLANLTFEPTQNMKEFSLSICKHCLELCSKFKHYKLIVERGFTILGHILPHSEL
jgi:hypothetical protein